MTKDSPFFSDSAPVHTSPKRERGICEFGPRITASPSLTLRASVTSATSKLWQLGPSVYGSLEPEAWSLRPRASCLRPQASSLKPQASSLGSLLRLLRQDMVKAQRCFSIFREATLMWRVQLGSSPRYCDGWS